MWIWVKDNFCLKDGCLSHSCHADVTPNQNRYEWEILRGPMCALKFDVTTSCQELLCDAPPPSVLLYLSSSDAFLSLSLSLSHTHTHTSLSRLSLSLSLTQVFRRQWLLRLDHSPYNQCNGCRHSAYALRMLYLYALLMLYLWLCATAPLLALIKATDADEECC